MTFQEYLEANAVRRTHAESPENRSAEARAQHELRLQYRAANPVISRKDEAQMIALLQDPVKGDEVAALLSVMPTFSRDLMHAMMRAAIAMRDPSWNRIFIEPCIRVYDVFAVNDFVLSVIAHGTKQEKTGATRCFYWMRSRIVHFSKGMGPMQKVMAEYRWNGTRYDNRDEKMNYYALDEQTMAGYEARVDKMRNDRTSILLDRVNIEMDVEILYALFQELPKSPEEFSDPEHQQRAEHLFRLKERELVMSTTEPYNKTTGDMSDEERKRRYAEAKEECRKLTAEVQARILKNCGR